MGCGDEGPDSLGVQGAKRIQRLGHRGGAIIDAGDQVVVKIHEGGKGHEWGLGNDRARADGPTVRRADGQVGWPLERKV